MHLCAGLLARSSHLVFFILCEATLMCSVVAPVGQSSCVHPHFDSRIARALPFDLNLSHRFRKTWRDWTDRSGYVGLLLFVKIRPVYGCEGARARARNLSSDTRLATALWFNASSHSAACVTSIMDEEDTVIAITVRSLPEGEGM